MRPAQPLVSLSSDDGVATVQLNRPETGMSAFLKRRTPAWQWQ
jgi:hypothetical protein